MSERRRDLLAERLEARIASMHGMNAKARATDAAALLREAITVLQPVERSPGLDRVAELLDDAATILITELGGTT